MEMFARVMHLRGMQQQQQQEQTAAQQEAEIEARLREATTPDEILAVVGPERGAKILQGLAAWQKTKQEGYQATQETIRDVLAGMDATPEGVRAEVYPQVRADMLRAGVITEQDAPEGYDPQWFARVRNFGQETPKPPADYTLGDQRFSGQTNQPVATAAPKPEAPPASIDAAILAAYRSGNDGEVRRLLQLKTRAGAAGREPQAAAPDNEPLQSIVGPDGKPVFVRRSDAVGKTPASGTSKPASGLEKRALNFFNRAQQADAELEALEPKIQAMSLGGQARLKYAPNVAQSQEGQSYLAAQRAFTEARLRKDSGAAIPEGEFENDRKTYFVQPGDSQETQEQKRRARAAILASLGFESGQALGEFIGDADEARKVVDDYKARAAKPDGKKKVGRFEIEVSD